MLKRTACACALLAAGGLAMAQTTAPTTRGATTLPCEEVRSGQTAPAPAPEWADRVKQPIPQFKWGADFRLREEWINNPGLDQSAPNHETDQQRYRGRLWGSFSPVKDFSLNARLAWEGRTYEEPQNRPDVDWSDLILDQLNVKFSNLFQTPSALTVGRQDITDLGNGWLLFDGTPRDGSRTLYMDAVRLTLSDVVRKKNAFDVIYINQFADEEDALIKPLGGTPMYVTEQNEQGAVLWWTNKDLERTELNNFFIYKHDDRVMPNGDQGDLYTFGVRAVHDFDAHWRARVEGAYQFGQRDNPVVYPNSDGTVSAWAVNSRLTYQFNDAIKNQLRIGYEYLSGDNPNTDTNEAFDPLWGRWPQWSELWIYVDAFETRPAETTNLHRIDFGWTCNPMKKMELCADYMLLFADQNTYAARPGYSDSGMFRGHLIEAVLRYTFNRFVSGNLVGEYFIPGDYYTSPKGDDAVYLRAELMFTF